MPDAKPGLIKRLRTCLKPLYDWPAGVLNSLFVRIENLFYRRLPDVFPKYFERRLDRAIDRGVAYFEAQQEIQFDPILKAQRTARVGDIYSERVAVLQLIGRDSLVDSAWIWRIVAGQKRDGGWYVRSPAFPAPSHQHLTALALTALGAYCVAALGMHGVLHIAQDPDDPIRNRTRLSRTREELLAATGSRYSPALPPGHSAGGLAFVALLVSALLQGQSQVDPGHGAPHPDSKTVSADAARPS
jgi:hypothetical protein